MDSAIVVVVILSSSLKVWRCWRQVQFHSQTSCSNEFCPFLLYRHTTSTFNVEQFVYNRRRCRTCLQFFHHLFPFSTFYIVIHCTTIFSFVIQLFPFSAFTHLNFLTSCNKLWTFLSIYICTFIASLHVFKQTNFQLFVQSLCSFQIVIFTIYWLYIFLFFHFSWSLRFFLVAIDYLTFRIKWKMFIHFYL